MRACEGCRRRKIKCDAATTNQWPCAACVRLKLHCVPPTVDYNRNHAGGGHFTGLEGVLDFDNGSGGEDDFHNTTSGPSYYDIPNPHDQLGEHQLPFSENLGAFQTPPYSERAPSLHDYSSYEEVPTIQLRSESFHEPNNFRVTNGQTHSARSRHVWSDDQYSTVELADVLGELKIHESGEGTFISQFSRLYKRRAKSPQAPYISQQKKSLAEAPAWEEIEVKLPITASGTGSTVRIPPELMPSDAHCMEWFEIFFTHIHPYVPVISKSYFYQQWHTNRRSISPLILEAIFACAGRMSDDPAQGAQWLALASSTKPSFSKFSADSLIEPGRARGLLYGCPKAQYHSSAFATTESQRIGAEEGLLL